MSDSMSSAAVAAVAEEVVVAVAVEVVAAEVAATMATLTLATLVFSVVRRATQRPSRHSPAWKRLRWTSRRAPGTERPMGVVPVHRLDPRCPEVACLAREGRQEPTKDRGRGGRAARGRGGGADGRVARECCFVNESIDHLVKRLHYTLYKDTICKLIRVLKYVLNLHGSRCGIQSIAIDMHRVCMLPCVCFRSHTATCGVRTPQPIGTYICQPLSSPCGDASRGSKLSFVVAVELSVCEGARTRHPRHP